MQKRKKNQWSCVLLQAMIRNAEVRFVFRGRIKESDQVLGMSDPGARAERGQSSPERSALKVENHQDFRPHRAVPEADGDEMPLEPDGPSAPPPPEDILTGAFRSGIRKTLPHKPAFARTKQAIRATSEAFASCLENTHHISENETAGTILSLSHYTGGRSNNQY
jgi:hypothetical protein